MSAELISLLREKGADINARDITGAAPLHYAVWHNEDFVDILLNNGADPNVATLPACGQYTPLHFAADIRKKSAIKSLLEKGADPTRIDAEGRSVLHHIVKDCGTTRHDTTRHTTHTTHTRHTRHDTTHRTHTVV